MNCPKSTHLIVALAAATSFPGMARAELWSALDTKPKPNLVIGYDTSVTMRINENCTDCHRRTLAEADERAFVVKRQLQDTMPLFDDYFVFGAFEYQGCGAAHIRARTLPDPSDIPGSYAATWSLLENIVPCDHRESRLPSGTAGTCLMPGGGWLACHNDHRKVQEILEGNLNGLSIPPPSVSLTNTTTTCGNPTSPWSSLDVTARLTALSGGFSWPRWESAAAANRLDATTVQTELCDTLRSSILQPIWNDLQRCLVDPQSYWDLSGIAGAGWCDASTIAVEACLSGHILTPTCICRETPSCGTVGSARSACNVPFTWRARQQVAVCEAYDMRPGHFGAALSSQSDNITQGGCRENVAMFFTDGYEGGRSGVGVEATNAIGTYASASGQPNMFVFRISNSFRGGADGMMHAVTGGQIPNAYQSNDADTMRSSFSRVLARVFKGDYAGSSPSFTPSGDRMVMSSFMVPGYTSASAPIDDTYIGWPNHLAWYEVQSDGTIASAPIFRTDEDGIAGRSHPTCNTRRGMVRADLFGPGNRFNRGNGAARNQLIAAGSLGDRDGDGNVDPPVNIRLGSMYGFGATRPVVVEGPNELPSPAHGMAWGSHVSRVYDRPRVVYTMGGGFVLGFYAGDFDGSGVTNGMHTSFTYDESTSHLGTEVLRYLPRWMRPTQQRDAHYEVENNDLVPQRLTTGSLIVREVVLDIGGTPTYQTRLIGAQGKEGSGYFSLDVSDPCTPGTPAEWLLPQNSPGPGVAYASARPEVYYMGWSNPNLSERAVVITTGGLDGRPELYAHDVRNGQLVSTARLPSAAGTSYPSAPACVDASGEGVVTHCYALRSDGRLYRVEVGTDRFGGHTDVTPTRAGVPITVAGSPTSNDRRFFGTEPIAFFGREGEVNLIFASGDPQHLTRTGGSHLDGVFKVVDQASSGRGLGTRTSVDDVCIDDGGGDTSGVMWLAPDERVVSAPAVYDGVVSWTSYSAVSSGCANGSGNLYAMRYDTCQEAISSNNSGPMPNPRPSGTPLSSGIPVSPATHPGSGTVVARTSNDTRTDTLNQRVTDTTSNGFPWVRKLYWRYELDVR